MVENSPSSKHLQYGPAPSILMVAPVNKLLSEDALAQVGCPRYSGGDSTVAENQRSRTESATQTSRRLSLWEGAMIQPKIRPYSKDSFWLRYGELVFPNSRKPVWELVL